MSRGGGLWAWLADDRGSAWRDLVRFLAWTLAVALAVYGALTLGVLFALWVNAR